jgi:hypothetical protein
MRLEEFKSRPSVIALVLANLVPLFGALFLGWDAFVVLLLYWTESLIVGFYTLLKIGLAKGVKGFRLAHKVFVMVFFSVHYGGFMIGHLIALTAIIGPTSQFPVLESLPLVAVAALAILLSHGYSFATNYIGKKEYERSAELLLMFSPYKRIAVMHIAIIFGAFLGIVVLGGPLPVSALVVLILAKTVIDLRQHLEERRSTIFHPASQAS